MDVEVVLKNFLGKTEEEAKEMCKHSAITEDFTYMTSAGLCYYLPAALSYLESDESNDDSDFADGLMSALFSQVSHFGVRGEPLVLINKIADYCDTHREKFSLDFADSFDHRLEKIRSISKAADAMPAPNYAKVHCKHCGGSFPLPDLPEAERAQVVSSVRRRQPIQATQLLRRFATLDLREANAIEMHITRSSGICVRCHGHLPATGQTECPNCGALNLDW